MNAYDSTYLTGAQQRLGTMLDFGVHLLGNSLSGLFQTFLSSPFACRFEAGDPAIVAGRSGQELALEVLTSSADAKVRASAQRQLSRDERSQLPQGATPEYWAGWALAFYQWASGYTFAAIQSRVPIENVMQMYTPYHEMDVRQFCDRMDELMLHACPSTNLQSARLAAGLSQSQLAKASGVPVRTLQQYEQRQKDINRARADYVIALARALSCSPQALLEHRAGPEYEYAIMDLPDKK